MAHVPNDDEIRLAIERLSQRDDKGNVILSKKEAEDVREVLSLYRKGKLIKTFLGYFAAAIAGYVAFKTDLLAFFGGGDK